MSAIEATAKPAGVNKLAVAKAPSPAQKTWLRSNWGLLLAVAAVSAALVPVAAIAAALLLAAGLILSIADRARGC